MIMANIAVLNVIASIIDVGFSAQGDVPNDDCIEVKPYRAPKVILIRVGHIALTYGILGL